MEDNDEPLTSGQFPITLDEKGRLMFPARLRANFSDTSAGRLVITKGVDKCLWLFTKEDWKIFSERSRRAAGADPKKLRMVQRHLLSPAQEAAFDRTGRIAVPSLLRELAGLVKEGVIHPSSHGETKLLELWDTGEFMSWTAATDDDYLDVMDSLV